MMEFQKLKIWQRSLALSVAVQRATKGRGALAPTGLNAQLNRACSSVPANIAEGCGYDAPLQTARFLDIAIGSLNESETHLLIAISSGVITEKLGAEFVSEVQQLRRMILKYKVWVLRLKT